MLSRNMCFSKISCSSCLGFCVADCKVLQYLLLGGKKSLIKRIHSIHTTVTQGLAVINIQGFWLPWWLSQSRIHLQCGKPGFDPWVEKIPWRRDWLPAPVFWPGEFHDCIVHGVTKSQTRLSDLHFPFQFPLGLTDLISLPSKGLSRVFSSSKNLFKR